MKISTRLSAKQLGRPSKSNQQSVSFYLHRATLAGRDSGHQAARQFPIKFAADLVFAGHIALDLAVVDQRLQNRLNVLPPEIFEIIVITEFASS